jgi:hypothetical protein
MSDLQHERAVELEDECFALRATIATLTAERDEARARSAKMEAIVALLVEELDDPCRVDFQKSFSAVWLSEPLRQRARTALLS